MYYPGAIISGMGLYCRVSPGGIRKRAPYDANLKVRCQNVRIEKF